MEIDTLSNLSLNFFYLVIPASTIFFKEKLRDLDFLQAVQSKIFDRVSNMHLDLRHKGSHGPFSLPRYKEG